MLWYGVGGQLLVVRDEIKMTKTSTPCQLSSVEKASSKAMHNNMHV